MPDALAAALRAALPQGVALGVAGDGPLWPGETLPGAVPQRLTEFAQGRSAARAAMQSLGHPAQAIPIGPDRAPQWPDGLTGSISHCKGACFAIVGARAVWAGLGLDIEPRIPVSPDLWPTILRPEEIAALPAADAGRVALLIFTAKEAVYKAQYALTATLFDFQTLAVSLEGHHFTATFAAPVGPFAKGHRIPGRSLHAGGFAAAFCAITAS